MKVLITNYFFQGWSGTELYSLDLATELMHRGHEATILASYCGEISRSARARGIKVVDNINDIKNESFDIIHAQHNIMAVVARSFFPTVPIIFMSHGVIPQLEQPPSVDLNINKYIAVSEETAESMIKKGVSKSKITIFYNAVDINKFSPKRRINKTPKKVLVLSNHFEGKFREVIVKLVKEMGLNFTHVGLPENPLVNVEKSINDADIVITLGIGVLEAMACGRNVIVYDIHGGDGLLTPSNYEELLKNNFSGRRYAKTYGTKSLQKEIQKYDPEVGNDLRDIIIKYHDKNVYYDKLIELYMGVLKNTILGINVPMKEELTFLLNSRREVILEKEELMSQIIQLKENLNETNIEKEALKSSLQGKDEELRLLRQKTDSIIHSRVWKIRNILAKTVGRKIVK